jgi:hypothetical protein
MLTRAILAPRRRAVRWSRSAEAGWRAAYMAASISPRSRTRPVLPEAGSRRTGKASSTTRCSQRAWSGSQSARCRRSVLRHGAMVSASGPERVRDRCDLFAASTSRSDVSCRLARALWCWTTRSQERARCTRAPDGQMTGTRSRRDILQGPTPRCGAAPLGRRSPPSSRRAPRFRRPGCPVHRLDDRQHLILAAVFLAAVLGKLVKSVTSDRSPSRSGRAVVTSSVEPL